MHSPFRSIVALQRIDLRTPSSSWAVGILTYIFLIGSTAWAQPPNARIGEQVPRDVREMYDRGLQYLARSQSENGDFTSGGGEQGAGVTGLAEIGRAHV